MTTTGDQLLDSSLATAGGKGLFVKELEQALLDGRADLAVHSMKDVPAQLPPGLCLSAFLAGEDPRDALVSNRHASLAALPPGSVVGTASLRRQAQLRALRPDLRTIPLRGNVGTRLRKLDEGACEAILLARAGLLRLGLAARIRESFDVEVFVPAIAQGVIGIECRDDDAATRARLAPLHDADSATRLAAERSLNQALGGACTVPVAGHAVLRGAGLRLDALVARARWLAGGARGPGRPCRRRRRHRYPAGGAPAGRRRRRHPGGPGPMSGGPAGLGVLVTRPVHQAAELCRAIEEAGGRVLPLPLLAIEPAPDPRATAAKLDAARTADWWIFTSANAVREAASLDAGGWPPGRGGRGHRRRPARRRPHRGPGAGGQRRHPQPAGRPELKDPAGLRILIVTGANSPPALAKGLRARGAQVRLAEAVPAAAGGGTRRPRWRRRWMRPTSPSSPATRPYSNCFTWPRRRCAGACSICNWPCPRRVW